MSRSIHIKHTVATLCLTAVAIIQPVSAEEEQSATIDVKPQPLATALQEFSAQSGLQVAYVATLADNKTSPGTQGEANPTAALDELLDGTNLEHQFINEETVAIGPAIALDVNEAQKSGKARPASNQILMAQNQTPEQQIQTSNPSDRTINEGDNEPIISLEEIIVTGTRIRGVSDEFFPIHTFTADDFESRGYLSIEDLVQDLPQNFGGGISADNRSAISFGGAGSSSFNLRGLGVGGTLTLLNGRRLAPSARKGTAVDVSAIPVNAIERVEVLADGASAIYGSDAVGGVINIIMRKDYEGAETRLLVGTITDGDGDQLQFGQTIGGLWDRGRAFLSYEYSTSDALDAKDKSFVGDSLNEPTEFLAATDRHSVFFSGAYDLSDDWNAFADIYFNDRASEQKASSAVSRFNNTTDALQYGTTVGAEFSRADAWSAVFSASYSRSEFDNVLLDLDNQSLPRQIDDSVTEVTSIEATLDGNLFSISGGSVRGVIGGSYREDTFDGLLGNPNSANPIFDFENDRSIASLFGEFYVPLVGEDNAMPGMQLLSLSLAGRYDDYDDIGSTFDPKFGVVWSPIEGLNLRGTFGTSFKAPRIDQINDFTGAVTIWDYVPDLIAPTVTIPVMLVEGTTTTLNPEEAETWTAGFDFRPTFARGLEFRFSYYDIVYDGRIATPTPSLDTSTFFRFDHPVPLITGVDQGTLQQLIDDSSFFLNLTAFLPGGSMSALADVSTIVDQRPVNTVATTVRGLDYFIGFSRKTEMGQWGLGINANYIIDFDTQFSVLRPVESRVDTLFNPADLVLDGTANWKRNGLTIAGAIHYVDSYTNNQVLSGDAKIEDWTTVDLSIRYDLGHKHADGALAGVVLTFSASNIFNSDPPRVNLDDVGSGGDLGSGTSAATGTSYDSANADPFGRRLSLLFTKSW